MSLHQLCASSTIALVFAFCPVFVQGQTSGVRPPPQPGILADTQTAPSLSVSEKFDYRLFRGFLVRGIAGAALGAGISQGTNTPSEWGQGAEGYFRRFGSNLGIAASRQAIEFGLEATTHQDPRYFPSREGGFKHGFTNVIKQVFFAKQDSGKTTIAYSRLISAFAAGQIGRAWQPRSTSDVGDGLMTTGEILAGDAGFNLLSEIFPRLQSKWFRKRRP